MLVKAFNFAASNMYHQLATLDTSRTTWKIKVHVTRMWPSSSKGSKGSDYLKGYNLILLDDNVRYILMHYFINNRGMLIEL